MARFTKKSDTESTPAAEGFDSPEAVEVQEAAEVETPEVSEPEEKEQRLKSKLSDGAKAAITKRALIEVQKELVKEEGEKFLEAEKARLRAEVGVSKHTLGGHYDEMVDIQIDLGYEGNAFIQINQPHGKCYYHGQTYRVPRHIANDLLWTCFQGAKLTRHTKGEKVWGRNLGYNSKLSAKVTGGANSGDNLN